MERSGLIVEFRLYKLGHRVPKSLRFSFTGLRENSLTSALGTASRC